MAKRERCFDETMTDTDDCGQANTVLTVRHLSLLCFCCIAFDSLALPSFLAAQAHEPQSMELDETPAAKRRCTVSGDVLVRLPARRIELG